MRGENDNPESRDAPTFIASWKALALPMLVVAIGYGGLLAWLALSGRSDGALIRACHIILALGVPLLAANALLRMATIKVQPRKHGVFVHVGFPRSGSTEVPYALVSSISVRYGATGRLINSGTLVIHLIDGGKVVAPDLLRPDTVRQDILRRMDVETPQPMAPDVAGISPSATVTTLA